MMNSFKFLDVYKKIYKENSKIYNFKSTATILLFFSKISNFISPIFVMFQVDPNKITYFNFILSITLVLFIFFGNENFMQIGVLLYFFCLIIDFCDGSVARYYKITSHYGKFIDGLVDIFLKTFLILSLSVYGLKITDNKLLILLGSISSLLASFDTFVLDRYSAIVRWFNDENKKNIKPYIRKTFLPRLTFLFSDIFVISVGFILFTKSDQQFLYYNLLIIFFVSSYSAIQNLVIHLIFSFKNLRFKNKG